MRRHPALPRARKPVEPQGRRKWYAITNQAGGDCAQVHIYAEIGQWGITADQFCRDLKDITAKTLDVRINSPGGDVFDGIAIHNALTAHPAKIHVFVDGVAASIASVIAMAGDRVTMARGSQMMIHEGHTAAAGTADDMRAQATLLDSVSDTIAGFYMSRAGGELAQWRGRMKKETWYSAEEAVAAGLADEVATPPGRATAHARFDLTVFNYAGRRQAPAPDITRTAPTRATATASQPDPLLDGLIATPSHDDVLNALLEGSK